MAIYKAIMQIPVFLSADNLDEARELLTGCRMDDFHREIAIGDWIGGEFGPTTVTEVPDHQIETELQAIGNDGSFFDPERERTADGHDDQTP
jgi:hypothetical protein